MDPSSAACRLLVVDDEELVREVVRDILTAEGYAVTATHDPLNAVELIWNEHFDVVLTDLGMPIVSGWAVAKQVKAKDSLTPVILLTGWGTQYEEADLSKCGVDLVLAKPLDWKRLTATVDEFMVHSVNSRRQECRKHWRFPSQRGELAKLSWPAGDLPPERFKVIDISRGGLSFRHSGAPNRPGALLSLDLFLKGGVEIKSVPCRVLYDMVFQEKSGLGQIRAARRSGVQFEKLSRSQICQLESCIRKRALDDESQEHS